MAPWGIMQSCTEKGSGGSDSGGGSSSGGNDDKNDDKDKDDEDDDKDKDKDDGKVECNPTGAGSQWGLTGCKDTSDKDDDKDKDKDKDEDEDDKDDDKKDDCRDNTNVAFYGSVTTGAAGSGRYTLASAGAPSRVVVSGTSLAATSGPASALDMVSSLPGASLAGVDTYQDVEDRLSNALGLSDPPPPPIKDDPEPEPKTKPKPPAKPPHLQGCPVKTPMNVLDNIPDYKAGKDGRKEWSEEVEKIAKQNPMTEDFTAEDALAIADYSGYKAETINKWLRNPANGDGDPNKLRDDIDRALDHLPPVEGTFYRGTFMSDEMLQKFASGESVEFPEYLSTSSDPAKADRALKKTEAKNIPGGENVLLEIETGNGRNIDPLSRYRGQESEVLIPRGGAFEKVGETTKIIGGKEYKVIKVKQVG